MLFLDSSALVKKYVQELGSSLVCQRLDSGERVFVSQLTYAECLAAFARKYQRKELTAPEFKKASEDFVWDWMVGFNKVEIDAKTMASVKDLVRDLRAADAIQLSAALWLRDLCRLAPERVGGERTLEFMAADGPLLAAAGRQGLKICNPENKP